MEGITGANMKTVLETEQFAMKNLRTLLKKDVRLVHLNLTCTNLSEKVLLQLLSKIKKAESL